MHVLVWNNPVVEISRFIEMTWTFGNICYVLSHINLAGLMFLFQICTSGLSKLKLWVFLSFSKHDLIYIFFLKKTKQNMFSLYILPPPVLYLCAHLFGMLVHSFHEGAHILRVHVRVKAMAQVGDVALRAKTLHHLLHDVGNPLLKEVKEGQSSGEAFSSSGFLATIFCVPFWMFPSIFDSRREH